MLGVVENDPYETFFVLQFDSEEGLILDQDVEGVNKDDILPELSESDAMVTEDDDITVLEENSVLSPTPDLSADAPESGSESFSPHQHVHEACCSLCGLRSQDGQWRLTCISSVFSGFVEEDLLLEDTVQTATVENLPPEEVPAEVSSPELPDVVTLPEPPVEVEDSGSGDLEPLKPAAPTKADVSAEHIEPSDGLVTGDDAIEADAILVVEKAEAEITTVEEAAIQMVDEEQINEMEIPEELEITTTASKTTYEEDLPALVLPPEAVDLTKEVPEPSETASAPVDKGSEEDSNFSAEQAAEEPGEDANVDIVLTNADVPVLEEDGMEAAAESEGEEVMEETLPEAPAIETEGSESPQILAEDLAEDEFLLVNRDETEPPMLDVVSHAQPTVLSPERESPFTRISDINPVTKEHPHVIIPSLVEVRLLKRHL